MELNKAIVFGANGYIGRHLCLYLKVRNVEFIPIDLGLKSIDNYPNYIQLNISEKKELKRINFDVDAIFIFSALTGTDIGFKDYEKFISVNEIGLLNILDCCVEIGTNARIIFPSTRLVYKGVENSPLNEEAEKEAKTIYAQNKLSCESYLKMYNNMFGLHYNIFRICVPYGNLFDNNYSYGTLGFFLSKAKKNENIVLFGSGNQKRTFTHVQDIVKIILNVLLMDNTKNEIYNIGSNDNFSLRNIAELIAERNNVNVDFVEWTETALKLESGDTILSDEKLKAHIDVKYENSIEDWIKNI